MSDGKEVMLSPLQPDGDDVPEALLPRRLLRLAAAQADVAEATALRAALGFPTRGDARERVLTALRALGVDVDALPQVIALTGAARRAR